MQLNKPQKELKAKILRILHRPLGFQYVYPEWNKKLWSKSTSDIKHYLLERFQQTDDVVEYYAAMVYLLHTVSDGFLLVEWHYSENRKRATASFLDDDAGTYKHLNEKSTLDLSGFEDVSMHFDPTIRHLNILENHFTS